MRRIKVLLLIDALVRGGALRQLVELALNLDKSLLRSNGTNLLRPAAIQSGARCRSHPGCHDHPIPSRSSRFYCNKSAFLRTTFASSTMAWTSQSSALPRTPNSSACVTGSHSAARTSSLRCPPIGCREEPRVLVKAVESTAPFLFWEATKGVCSPACVPVRESLYETC